jgi:hypothetical protein
MTEHELKILQAVVENWDRANSEESYDELRFERFRDMGGVEPLRELLTTESIAVEEVTDGRDLPPID